MEQKRNPYLVNKALRSFLIAAILATASTNLAVVVDGIIVGQLIGANALAAVNLTMPMMQIVFTITMLISIGTSILAAMSLGKGDNDTGNRYYSLSITLAMVIGLVVSISSGLLYKPIAQLLCSSGELLPYVTDYITTILISAPVYFVLPVLCTFLRIDGAAKLTAIAMVVANVVNILLDIILIDVVRMGLEGASIATTIGNVVGVSILLIYIFSKRCNLKLCRIHPMSLQVGRAIVLALPTALALTFIAIKLIAINHIIIDVRGALGASYLGASISLMMIVSLFVSGVSQSVQPIGGVLIGQGDDKGLQLLIREAIKILLGVVIIVLATIEIFTPTFAAFFGLNAPEIIGYASEAIRIVSLNFVPFVLTYFLIVVYQLSNRATLAITISVIQPLMVIIVMAIVSKVAPEMIWWSFLISESLVFSSLCVISIIKHFTSKDKIEPLTLLKITDRESTRSEFSIESDNPESLAIVLNEIDMFLETNQISLTPYNQVRLTTEEIVANILKFGYTQSDKRYIDINVVIKEKTLSLCIKDDGIPFNPLENKNLNHGLGLMILQNMPIDIKYKYILNQNTIFMTIAVG